VVKKLLEKTLSALLSTFASSSLVFKEKRVISILVLLPLASTLVGLQDYPLHSLLTITLPAGYDIEDWEGNERYGFDAVIDTQDLAEYYMPAFEACVRDSDVRGIMCSYNAVSRRSFTLSILLLLTSSSDQRRANLCQPLPPPNTPS